MNLFKKATATVALVTLVSGVFSTGVSAYNAAELAAAEALAAAGVINNQATAADYKLDSTITRGEIAKVAANVADIAPFTTCEGKFSDVSATAPNTWVCGYVEALLAEGKVSANAEYNSERNLSKAEALKLMLEAAGHTGIYTNAATWQEEVVAYAVSNDVLAASFSDYNTSALRGWVFNVADKAMEEDEISLPDIIPGIDDEDITDETTDETTDTTTPSVPGDNELVATLSASTPDSMDITEDAKGVRVLEFDVTAGSEDVTISSMELERTGFGSAAADEVAIFSEEGRVSKNKSFNSSDDTANVTFSPALVVKAGETQTLVARVNVDGSGEFAVKVIDINATTEVTLDEIESNTFDAKNGVNAAKLLIKNESVNKQVTAGEEQADVAEFNLANDGATGTTADVDTVVTSITLKEVGTIDQEEYLENLTLTVNGNVVSEVASMNGKYVTFDFEGVSIEDGKNESFLVKADITGDAGKTVRFELASLVDIEASASRYNSVNVEVDSAPTADKLTFDEVDVQAGELTIYSIDAERDEIRSDRDNVVLGQLKIVNVAGKNLELDNIKFELDLDGASTASVDTLQEVIENVEIEVNGTSYDLNDEGGTTTNGTGSYYENDLDITLPQGTTILTVRADTLKNLDDGTKISMALNNAGSSNWGLAVFETEDDEIVGDVSPSSLSWDTVEVKNASVEVANIPLADVKVVKGASDIVALQFEIEAGKSSDIILEEVIVEVEADSAAATKNQVAQVALYKWSVSDANLLDRKSGSRLDSNGKATFDGFELTIAADKTETFVVTLDTVDTTDVVNKVLQVKLDKSELKLKDDENKNLPSISGTIADKLITVNDSGSLTLEKDANNEDNEDPKTVLAGEEAVVYSADVLATNEDVKVETVEVSLSGTIAGTGSFKDVFSTAKLYLDDKLVATASNSDINADSKNGSHSATGVVVFDNISELVVPTETAELRVAFDTENIGNEKVGIAASEVEVTKIKLDEAEGKDSGENVDYEEITDTGSNKFAVVPAKLTLSVVKEISAGTAKVKVTVDTGNNTKADSNAAPVVKIKDLVIKNKAGTGALKFFEEGESTELTAGSFDVVISGSKTFEIVPQDTTEGQSYTLSVPTDGMTYTVNDGADLKVNMTNELDLGTKSY